MTKPAPNNQALETVCANLWTAKGWKDNGEEVHHFVAHGVGIEVHARGVLHPTVGYQDPPSRECGSKTSEPSGGEVEAFADFAPTEEH